MKPIVVAVEVTPKGEAIKECFTMINGTLDENIRRMKTLPAEFKSGSYKTSWSSARVRKADAVIKRGNKLAFKAFLF